MSLNVYLSALALSASQIVGIGPQNAFVIRQGIGRQHVLPIVLICIVCDVLLIAAGVLGMGRLVAALPGFVGVVTWAGAAFLLWLSFKAFRAAWQPGRLDASGGIERDRKKVIRTILLVTLLNPYVWLDTVVLIGSVSSVYGTDNAGVFLLGCITSSVLWFVLVGFGAGRLAPWFEKPASWRLLDVAIGCIMLLTAIMLVRNYGLG
ncbi:MULTISPECIES: LysE/ArgO family amino acid transporter [Vogesella]|jgi:L-lysine exporter family protein LysE/ArgO|uniref:L-lysine exporter family protein LysE/ArgO n=1 Tax=Vogesella indigofera TaxID=45465 RepID=A0A495BLS6_VOGIN|nr:MULTISPECIES: LysE/ArgO family amino acid transporter [Vogesella]MCQ4142987.1 LysE/ArgO family amino acid transporter [Vogesella sp. AC12]MDC7698222.1 LysE/ArgO family amino acid transporter [Vogesella indigofera]RKQ60943.1 L-lysine exporter family protein LysE/ArgO [Vogesella indigofera]